MATVIHRVEALPDCPICLGELTLQPAHVVRLEGDDMPGQYRWILFIPLHCERCERDWSMVGWSTNFGTIRLEATLGDEVKE